jgi:DNA-binding transcriptional LysR family regulator
MHLEVEQLRALATLAEELNFTRAARRLGVAQPALSARISRMERRLGRKLVERSTRSVQLTDAGLELLARAKPMLDGQPARQLSRGSSG